MDSTQNFGENFMNLNMNNNQLFMNNQIGINNNQICNQNLIQNPMINQYNNSIYNINSSINQNYNNMILNNQFIQMMNMMNQMMMNMNMMLNNNQMNQNFMNNNNNGINDDEIYNLDKDKFNLINSIIGFFKENNYPCMNFEYPNQIKAILNLLNENYSGFIYENDIKDPLFYINSPTIIIKFINSNYEVKKVKIPKLITQYDLYTVANLYKLYNNSNILLAHKNKILKKDESSIDCISDNDNLIIIEQRYFPDDSYYNSLMKKSSNNFHNVHLSLNNGKRLHKSFPNDITIVEICKTFYLILGSSNNDYFIYDLNTIDLNDKRKLEEFPNDLSLEIIQYHLKSLGINALGKQINITIYSNEITFTSHHYRIGILNNIKI